MEKPPPDARQVLSDTLAAFLAKSGTWGSKADISARMQRERQQIDSGSKCSHLLSDEFDQSLFFLPGTIEYLASLPFGNLPDEDYENDLDWTTHAVASFLRTWHSVLCDTSMMDAVIAPIESVLDEWNRTFPPPRSGTRCDDSDSESWISLIAIPPSAVCLDHLLEAKVPYQDTTLFEFFFHGWTDEKRLPPSSANLLMLFMYIKCIGGDSLLYRNPLVLKSTFDKSLCTEHWQSARLLIETQCPQTFVAALQQELL